MKDYSNLKVNDYNCFLSGEYRTYDVGEELYEFFDEFVDEDGYKDISFIFNDFDKRPVILKEYYTTCVLDIRYDEERYSELKADILPSTDKSCAEPQPTDYVGNFFMTKVTLDSEVYNDNFCGICFDDDYHIIRYIFIHRITGDIFDAESILNWNVSLNWNRSENDLVFEES